MEFSSPNRAIHHSVLLSEKRTSTKIFMATRIFLTLSPTPKAFAFKINSLSDSKPKIPKTQSLHIASSNKHTICLVSDGTTKEPTPQIYKQKVSKSKQQRNSNTPSTQKKPDHYNAALLSCFGVIFMVVLAVCFRFSWQMKDESIAFVELFVTLASSVSAAVGMEFLSRWTHRLLWHDSLWHIHESHHRGEEGSFELNDVFGIVNAVPAIALIDFGFFHEGLVPAACFGAGLGMTLLGMAYIFVHNGLVHRRFPVGPISNIPYFNKVAAAHQIHHSNTFQGVPYGLFLGPQELEEVGGAEELAKVMNRRINGSNSRRRI